MAGILCDCVGIGAPGRGPGERCRNAAAWRVTGRYFKPHYQCDDCKRETERHGANWAYPPEFARLTPRDHLRAAVEDATDEEAAVMLAGPDLLNVLSAVLPAAGDAPLHVGGDVDTSHDDDAGGK